VTLDLDFANPLRFRPSQYAGVAVLRLPEKPSAADLDALVRTLAAGLTGAEAQSRSSLGRLARRLWIVEKGRIRAYEEPGFEPE